MRPCELTKKACLFEKFTQSTSFSSALTNELSELETCYGSLMQVAPVDLGGGGGGGGLRVWGVAGLGGCGFGGGGRTLLPQGFDPITDPKCPPFLCTNLNHPFLGDGP